ncbi:MAG TPA: protein kinase [Pyrinomonadaceae bacterium]
MNPERWQELEKLFQEALAQPPEKRTHVIESADEDLRPHLKALLAAHESAGTFIESPAIDVEARNIANLHEPHSVIGKVISHYRVLEHLGAGGMGDVYLAQDITLGRQVALKFLPSNFTLDSERLRRFEQEARAASSLNHPNILTIYEIGEWNSCRYIASEFIEGSTLRELIGGQPMKIDEAIDITIQVADALISAHSKGIVHRDIKPENIMICRGGLGQKEGHIKVLDFGIAKLTEAQSSETDLPTRPLLSTSEGITIGTAPYMSPEQADGLKVDARTDIWSLSVVLYEMLSGHVPFEGATRGRLIVSILEKEPRPLSELVDNIPAVLESLVMKGLCKRRDDRYQTAREFQKDLNEFRRHPEGLESRLTAEKRISLSTQSMGRSSSWRSRAPILTIIGAVVLTLFGLGIKYVWPRLAARNTPPPFSKFNLTRLTSHGKASSAVVSPDGKYVVHVAGTLEQKSLWLRHIATGSDQQILPSNGGDISNLSFSPDGNHIYYVRSAPKDIVLETIPVLGGTPRRLLHDIDSSASFSPNSQRFVFVRGYPINKTASLMLANQDGTGEEKLITHDMNNFFFGTAGDPAWSPDGDHIAVPLRGSDSYTNVVVVDVKTKTEKQLTFQRWNAIHSICWLPDATGLLFTAIDAERKNAQIFYSSYPEGKVETVTNDLNNYEDLSVTADGTSAVTVRSEGESDIWISSVDDFSNPKQITSNKFDGVAGIAWTPDGKMVHGSNESGTRDLWLMNNDGSDNRQLTANVGLNLFPCVSADGKYVIFQSNRSANGSLNIWRMNIDGTNPTQLSFGTHDVDPRCTLDNHIIYTSDAQGQLSVWKLPVEGGTALRITDYYASALGVSPLDGSIAIGLLDEKVLRRRTGVIASTGGRPTKIFDLPALFGTLGPGFYGQTTSWTVDGKSLTYIDTKDDVSNIWAQPVGGGPPKQLTRFKSDLIFYYAWSRDGKKLALARGRKTSDVVLIKDLSKQSAESR